MSFSLKPGRWWKEFVLIVFVTFFLVATITNRSMDWIHDLGSHENDVLKLRMADVSVTHGQRHLILHVGPSKTATTSLQTDLTTYRHDLEDDGYWYAGRYYDLRINETDGSFRTKRSESALLLMAHNMFEDCTAEFRVDCCREFVNELNQVAHHSGFHRIIISEEPFGNQWDDPDDWLAIREALGDGWNVTVLVGYRRFYSWWISAHFQRERTDRSHNGFNDLWPKHGGQAKIPLFPNWWRIWTTSAYHQAPFNVLETIQNTFPVRIINLHDETLVSPSRMVLCDVLDTPKACQKIELRPETVLNTQEDVPSSYYDAIATKAADMGFVNIEDWSRSDVRELVRAHQEDELGLGPNDLPLKCPEKSELQALLNMSLSIEAKYLPDFATSKRIEEHKAGFWEENYCFVDADRVMENVGWRNFFKNALVKNLSTRYL